MSDIGNCTSCISARRSAFLMGATQEQCQATACEFHASQALSARITTLEAERDRFKLALDKINGIRNSIIGIQGFNFSEHAYPLVAALDAVLRETDDAYRSRAIDMRAWALSRIEWCRREEAKFGAGNIAIEASTERRALEAVMRQLDDDSEGGE